MSTTTKVHSCRCVVCTRLCEPLRSNLPTAFEPDDAAKLLTNLKAARLILRLPLSLIDRHQWQEQHTFPLHPRTRFRLKSSGHGQLGTYPSKHWRCTFPWKRDGRLKFSREQDCGRRHTPLAIHDLLTSGAGFTLQFLNEDEDVPCTEFKLTESLPRIEYSIVTFHRVSSNNRRLPNM